MRYTVYYKGKNMSATHTDAIAEYSKRLSAYCDISLCPLPTLKLPAITNNKNHIFVHITKAPSTYSSEEFSQVINQYQLSGKSNIHYFIGYSQNEFYEAIASLELDSQSYSTMSLTNSSLSNDTIAVLLHEQIYRGYTILQGKTYHK